MDSKSTNIIQKFMEHIKNFDTENYIKSILFCFASPTIKGIKAGCLINFRRRENENIKAVWKQNADKWLKPLNVQWLLLNENCENKNALVLIYRRELLASALGCAETCEILKSCGYPLGDLDGCLTCLKKKIACKKCCSDIFPHEIGLFLDYPPHDVKCFMNGEKCENQLRKGYWKVYGNVKQAALTFAKYRKAECDAALSILTGSNKF